MLTLLYAMYMDLYNLTYFDPMVRFQLPPPGWPALKLRICCGHCSNSRHSSSSTLVFNFSRFKFYPPGPVPACQPMSGAAATSTGAAAAVGAAQPRLRLQPAATGAAAAAVALRASGGFPLLSLGSWQRLPVAQ
jgi:hypothetical protein